MKSPRRKFLRQAAVAGSLFWLPKFSLGKPKASNIQFVLLSGGIRPCDVEATLRQIPNGALKQAAVKLVSFDDPQISHQTGMAYFQNLPFQEGHQIGKQETGAYVLDGFDCAHFNAALYRKKIGEAFAFLHAHIESANPFIEWVICSEMGRNREVNHVHEHPHLSGIDHHLPEARTTFCIQLQSNMEVLPGNLSMRRLSHYLGRRFQLA
jgi:hypothetical protein